MQTIKEGQKKEEEVALLSLIKQESSKQEVSATLLGNIRLTHVQILALVAGAKKNLHLTLSLSIAGQWTRQDRERIRLSLTHGIPRSSLPCFPTEGRLNGLTRKPSSQSSHLSFQVSLSAIARERHCHKKVDAGSLECPRSFSSQ